MFLWCINFKMVPIENLATPGLLSRGLQLRYDWRPIANGVRPFFKVDLAGGILVRQCEQPLGWFETFALVNADTTLYCAPPLVAFFLRDAMKHSGLPMVVRSLVPASPAGLASACWVCDCCLSSSYRTAGEPPSGRPASR